MTINIEYLSLLNPGWAVRSSVSIAAVRPDAMLESYSYDVIHKHSIQASLKEQADNLNETEADQSKAGFRPPCCTHEQSSIFRLIVFKGTHLP